MTAHRLPMPVGTGRVVRLNRTEASTLTGFQRSAYAEPIKAILLKLLDESRLINETETATEENRMRVAAAKELIEVLFTGKVELEA